MELELVLRESAGIFSRRSLELLGNTGFVKPEGSTDRPPTSTGLYGLFSPKSIKPNTSLESCVLPALFVIQTSIFVINTPEVIVGGLLCDLL
ncbi:hypothetical protein D3C72_1767840 [compost metagenome]